jgi:CBS domain-containing protein
MGKSARMPFLDASIGDLCVADAMHDSVISCPPETSLRTVARMLATYRVHAIVVYPRHFGDLEHVTSWRVVSDLDLARAAREGDLDTETAGEIADTPVCCMSPSSPLKDAVEAMLTNGVSHVFVIDEPTARPIGVLSTLDVARALAGLVWPGLNSSGRSG